MTFDWDVRIYWENTDAGGVVYHSEYLAFLERCRTEWLRSHGINQSTLEAEFGGLFVVREANIAYLKPAKLDEILTVSSQVKELRKSAVCLDQKIINKDNEQLLIEAQITLVYITRKTFKPKRMPENIRRIFI